MRIFLCLIFSWQTLAYKAPTNERLRIGYTQELNTLHPLLVSSAYGGYARRMLGRPLFAYGANGKVPQLVEKVPTFENGLARFEGKGSKKNLVTTWTIKKGAKWGDGTPVTAKDIYFSWQAARNPVVGAYSGSEYQRIAKVRLYKDNSKKFDFVHAKSQWNFNDIDIFALPAHLEEGIYKKSPEKYVLNSLYVNQPANPGLYNGPYLVKEFKIGSHLIVERNPHFFGKNPAIKSIVYQVIPHSGAIDSYIRSGTIDMAAIYSLSMEQGITLAKRYKKDGVPVQLNSSPGIFTDGLLLNMEHPILSSKKIRKALRLSLRIREISQGVFMGHQLGAFHFVPPGYPGFPKKGIRRHRYSLEKAKKLIEEEGWKKGRDGFYAKNGKPLSLVFKTAAGKRDRERVQVYVKQQWKKLGVLAIIKNEPVRVLYGQSRQQGKYDVLLGSKGFSPVTSPVDYFHSKSIPTKANGFVGLNNSLWRNEKVDRLSEAYVREFSDKKRQKILVEIVNESIEDMPWIPLYHLADLSMTPQNLRGYELLGTGYPPTDFIEHWVLK